VRTGLVSTTAESCRGLQATGALPDRGNRPKGKRPCTRATASDRKAECVHERHQRAAGTSALNHSGPRSPNSASK
jgi:hypothetical protein